jgi:hypothetical protein
MSFVIKGTIDGVKELLERLDGIDKKVRKKILRAAINQASKLLLAEAKQHTPVASGLLRKSLGRKIKAFRNSGMIVGIVGPREHHRQRIGGCSKGRVERKQGRRKSTPAGNGRGVTPSFPNSHSPESRQRRR